MAACAAAVKRTLIIPKILLTVGAGSMTTRPEAATIARRAVWAKVSLGAQLAREGAAAKTALAVGVLIALGFAAFVAKLAARPGESAVAEGVALASTGLAWAAGVLLIIAASAHTFVRDRESGVIALFAGHAAGKANAWRSYVSARTLGLALTLFALVGGGSLVAACGALFGAITAHQRHLPAAARLLDALRGLAGSLVYGAGFALVLAPLAAATMGARKRVRGYGLLYGVLLLPELVVLGAGPDMAAPWRDVVTIPGALGALRTAVLLGLGTSGDVVPSVAFGAAECALVPLAVYILLSVFALRRELGREEVS